MNFLNFALPGGFRQAFGWLSGGLRVAFRGLRGAFGVPSGGLRQAFGGPSAGLREAFGWPSGSLRGCLRVASEGHPKPPPKAGYPKASDHAFCVHEWPSVLVRAHLDVCLGLLARPAASLRLRRRFLGLLARAAASLGLRRRFLEVFVEVDVICVTLKI